MQPAEPIGIAGSGRLAQALGRALRERGEPVAYVASRNEAHARSAAEFIGGGVAPVELAELPRRAGRLILAVSDDGLRPVIDILSSSETSGGIALHTCGARDLEDYAPLRKLGFSCGTLHPLQTFSDPLRGMTALRGTAFAVSGDARALEWARQIAETLGGRWLEILPGKRALYHAAAVMASNYTVALLDAAQELMAMATTSGRDAALEALAPLARTAVANALERGPVAALTGPIERGDAETVARHLAALGSAPERIQNLYVAAGMETLDLARRKGLSESAAARLQTLFGK